MQANPPNKQSHKGDQPHKGDRPNQSGRQSERSAQSSPPSSSNTSTEITREIINTINGLSAGLQAYPIRDLVKHAQEFGPYLKKQRLETNQIRKFLDAVNRLKADLTQAKDFSAIETEVVLLKPKLAYAAARQSPAKPLSDVISVAIDHVHNREDFDRFVQLIESIIAYHKEEGGK